MIRASVAGAGTVAATVLSPVVPAFAQDETN
jgi:hypothetical protein